MEFSFGHGLVHTLEPGLRLSPEMHLSLRVLGLSLREVGLELRTALESNPCLEEDPASELSEPTQDAKGSAEDDPNADDLDGDTLSCRFDDFPGTAARRERSRLGASPEPTWPTFEPVAPAASLAEHLMLQIAVSPAEPEVKAVARLVVGNLNEDGYLEAEAGDLLRMTREELGAPVAPALVGDALALVRSLDPIGIGWSDRQASLLAQLRARGGGDTEVPARLIGEAWDLLTAGRWDALLKKLGIGRPELTEALAVVGSLDLRPGARFAPLPPVAGPVDLVVRQVGTEYVLEINDGDLPRLRLSAEYRDLARSLKGSPGEATARTFIREHLISGGQLLRCVHRRSMTLARISRLVFARQTDFLGRGLGALRPLQMTEVAEELGLSVSTVSRAVENKLVATPVGTFPLRQFFSAGLPCAAPSAPATAAIRERVRMLIAGEPAGEPRTDRAIQELLLDEGVEIALSTVRKYREALGFPATHIRRQVRLAG